METGLFFGSFNPIHHGHLIVASHILETGLLKEIWFVVSPQNPFKNPGSLLNENHRFRLVQDAIEGDPLLKASNIEFKLPKPSFTTDTLAHLKEKFPSTSFSIIMGSDSFQNIEKWKNAKHLLKNYPIIVYPRRGHEPQNIPGAKVTFTTSPFIEISSTHIRELIRKRKSIRYYVPESVRLAIETNMFYFSPSENPSQQ